MAKGILEFDLNEPDEIEAYKRAVKALDLVLALWDIDQYLRTQTKYNESLTEDQHKVMEKAREEFYDIINKHNISFNELLS